MVATFFKSTNNVSALIVLRVTREIYECAHLSHEVFELILTGSRLVLCSCGRISRGRRLKTRHFVFSICFHSRKVEKLARVNGIRFDWLRWLEVSENAIDFLLSLLFRL